MCILSHACILSHMYVHILHTHASTTLMYMHVHFHTVQPHTLTCMYKPPHIHSCIYSSTYMYGHTFTHMYIHIHFPTCTCMHTPLSTHALTPPTFFHVRWHLNAFVVCSNVEFLVLLLHHFQGSGVKDKCTLQSATSCRPVNYFKWLMRFPVMSPPLSASVYLW